MRSLAALALLVGTAAAGCGSHSDCASCTADSGCAWCPESQGGGCKSTFWNPLWCAAYRYGNPNECHQEVLPKGELDILRKYAKESYVTYCPASQIKTWDCYWCDELTGDTGETYTVTMAEERTGLSFDSQGFVAYTPTRIVIAFRGTEPLSLQNWVTNFNFIPSTIPWMNDDDIKTHVGFYQAYNQLRDDVLSGFDQARTACPTCIVHVVGHSLGGAQATVCVTDLVMSRSVTPDGVYTFGSPRVGNQKFVDWWVSKNINTVRYVDGNDLVPHVPPAELGFRHVTREAWERGAWVLGSWVPANEAIFCDGGEDPACSNSVPLITCGILDHLAYIGSTILDVCPQQGWNLAAGRAPADAGVKETKSPWASIWVKLIGGLVVLLGAGMGVAAFKTRRDPSVELDDEEVKAGDEVRMSGTMAQYETQEMNVSRLSTRQLTVDDGQVYDV
eukprot:Hpha_TRINITY_DN33983_c0_g1::TRINITY_DN33983_c0_g1_i1::g.69420::m.69420